MIYNNPLISIIVPVYKVEKYIENCIKSLINQTYKNLEIILIDDGSPDRSGEICDKYASLDNRIKVFHFENGGVSAARNKGVEYAKGDYIGFVDSDDWVDHDMYETLFRLINEYTADIAICGYREIYPDKVEEMSNKDIKVMNNLEALELNILNDIDYQICTAPWNKLYKKEIVKNIKFPEGKVYEDIIFTTKALIESNKCVYQGISKYNYLAERTGSTMNMGFNSRSITDELPLLWDRINLLKDKDVDYLYKLALDSFVSKLLYYYSMLDLYGHSSENNLNEIINKYIQYVNNYSKDLNKVQRIKLRLFETMPNILKFFYYKKMELGKTR